MQPTISAIITTYNRSDYLREAIDSVLGQTYSDWECIVVDDGSTDNTREVVESYIQKDARIRYVWQTNSKLPAARNTGVREAKTNIIAFLDDDDVWLPNYLEATSLPLREDPTVVLAASPRIIWDGKNDLEVVPFSEGQHQDALKELIRGAVTVPSQTIFRRSTALNTQGFRVYGSEDYDMELQLLTKGKAVLLREPLLRYRVHSSSSMASDPNKRRALAYAHMEVLNHFIRQPDAPFPLRLLAMANLQRKHEHLLQFDMEEGKSPKFIGTRFWQLLTIFPSPILRSPKLAMKYLLNK